MIELLRIAGDQLIVPGTVIGEVGQGDPSDPAIRALRTHDWLISVADVPIPRHVAALGLDPGETAVLAWALAHPGSEVILDDRAARREATALGVPLRGTLSLILEAKRRGVVPQARPVVEAVRNAGLYLSDRLAEESLRLVGE